MSDVGDLAADPGLAVGATSGRREAKALRPDDQRRLIQPEVRSVPGGRPERTDPLRPNRTDRSRGIPAGRQRHRRLWEGVSRRRGPGPGRCRQASDQAPRTRPRARRDRGHRAPGRPRWSPLHRADASDPADARSTPANQPPRSGTPARRNRPYRGIRRAPSPVCRRSPASTPAFTARCPGPPRSCRSRASTGDSASVGMGSTGSLTPISWRSWSGSPVRRRPGDGSSCAPRLGREPGGGARGPVPGHDDGVHPRIRPGHGNAQRRPRPKFECVPRQSRRNDAPAVPPHGQPGVRPPGSLGDKCRHARPRCPT